MVASLVGLPVEVVGVIDDVGAPIVVVAALVGDCPSCPRCGVVGAFVDRREVELIDLPVFGRQCRLRLRKRRFRCGLESCVTKTYTEQNALVAPPRHGMTTRAGKWCCRQLGAGHAVSTIAATLGCDWNTANTAGIEWGAALLAADAQRVGITSAVGLDEVLMGRAGPKRILCWSTSIVDVARGRLLDVVEGRDSAPAIGWLRRMPSQWRDAIRWASVDLSGAYRRVCEEALPDARIVADPFHVVRLGNTALDECRRRVQNDTLGHRGRKTDPLYRARKLLLMAHERIDTDGDSRLRGLLDAGDPRGEVSDAWHAKEVLRSIFDIDDPQLAQEFLTEMSEDFRHWSRPIEVRRLGRTLHRWHDQIIAWHDSRITNAATEANNNLIKRVKRAAFGLTNFHNYRIRALLYAGGVNWQLLDALTHPEI